MKILVTGATGFVGSVLMPRLIERAGAESLSAYLMPDDQVPPTWAGRGVRVLSGDIADEKAVADAVEGHSHVIHMAGFISYWKRDLPRLMTVNRDGVRCVVDACLRHRVRRLIHVSSIGAIGFHKNGELAAEDSPNNWPPTIPYMASKYEGQRIVDEAVRERGLPAVIINPASIMGPGARSCIKVHNQLYRRIAHNHFFGAPPGGVAIVDVRDLVEIILKSFERGRIGEKYLAVGANIACADLIRLIGRTCGRDVHPVKIPAPLFAAAGGFFEFISLVTHRRPLLTLANGRIGGWKAYYSNDKSRRELGHSYIPIEKTIADGWAYFAENFRGDDAAAACHRRNNFAH